MNLDTINKVILEALSKGYQISPEALNQLRKLDGLDLLEVLQRAINLKKDKFPVLKWEDFEKVLPNWILSELSKESIPYEEIKEDFKVLKEPIYNQGESSEDFHHLFKSRYLKLLKILNSNFKKINEIDVKEKGVKRVVGLLMEKEIRRNKARIVLDDLNSSITLLALEDRAVSAASELLLDQLVIAEFEVSKNGSFIAKNFYHPDFEYRVSNFSSKEVYVVLTSDLHIGSKAFLLEAFKRFLAWLKSNDYVAKKVKYIIFAGDIVDGVGVYPQQEKELETLDLREQFSKAILLLKEIPQHIRLIIIPGNHDPVRQALPQPPLPKTYVKDLYNMNNVTLLGNPSMVSLHGVKVLIYHGQSLYDVVASIPNSSFSKPAKAMRYLLKARHLAPSYGQRTLLAPEKEDQLVIDEIPDIFHAGHIHVLDSDNYKGTLIINSGAWQAKTIYQENMGIEPTPGIIAVVNLSNFEVLTKDFTKVSF